MQEHRTKKNIPSKAWRGRHIRLDSDRGQEGDRHQHLLLMRPHSASPQAHGSYWTFQVQALSLHDTFL